MDIRRDKGGGEGKVKRKWQVSGAVAKALSLKRRKR